MKEVQLTQGYVALVDDADYPKIAQNKWHISPDSHTDYAQRIVKSNGRSRSIRMHREILNAPGGLFVDHINGNGLDNRRENLRLCTPSQNQGNRHVKTDGYRGVTFDKRGKCWRATLTVYDKAVWLGYFTTAEAAARAYDFFALAHWGEFARVNFPALRSAQ